MTWFRLTILLWLFATLLQLTLPLLTECVYSVDSMMVYLKCWSLICHSGEQDGDLMGFYGTCQPGLAEKVDVAHGAKITTQLLPSK